MRKTKCKSYDNVSPYLGTGMSEKIQEFWNQDI